jgi:DNA-binding IclR family transcriptional regulator
VSRRQKTIIHRKQHRNHIQEVVQVGAVGDLEEEEAEGVGLAVAVVDGDNNSVLRESHL